MKKILIIFVLVSTSQFCFSQTDWVQKLNLFLEPIPATNVDTLPGDSVLFDFSSFEGTMGVVNLQFQSSELLNDLDTLHIEVLLQDSLVLERSFVVADLLNFTVAPNGSDTIYSMPVGSTAYSEELNFTIQKVMIDGTSSSKVYMQQ